jgi:hypothetical protein
MYYLTFLHAQNKIVYLYIKRQLVPKKIKIFQLIF